MGGSVVANFAEFRRSELVLAGQILIPFIPYVMNSVFSAGYAGFSISECQDCLGILL